MSLSDVTILITSFLRAGCLRHCLQSISENLPECAVSIACDDNMLPWPGYSWAYLPFDSGLTVKRNAAVKNTKTKYALLACDDFNFFEPSVKEGIERMADTLDAHPEVDVVVGTYNQKEYEGFLEWKPGEYIKEHRLQRDYTIPVCEEPYPAWKIDIGINYFLARTGVLREIPWDETIRPIGGEHGDWFLQMKQAGKLVVFVPGCPITSFPRNIEWEHPDYMKYRRRAMMGHEIFLKKRGVKRYYGFDEKV